MGSQQACEHNHEFVGINYKLPSAMDPMFEAVPPYKSRSAPLPYGKLALKKPMCCVVCQDGGTAVPTSPRFVAFELCLQKGPGRQAKCHA